MAKKRVKPEQMVTLLRQIEVAVANGKTTPHACKEAEVAEQTDSRGRKAYGGLKVDQARRFNELENENARVKRVVADRALEKQVLRDVAQGSVYAPSDGGVRGHALGAVRAIGTARVPASRAVARQAPGQADPAERRGCAAPSDGHAGRPIRAVWLPTGHGVCS